MFHFHRHRIPIPLLLKLGAKSQMDDESFITTEIARFRNSRRHQAMLDGERYYAGRHDILFHQRTVIGAGGKLEVVENLPNNRIVDNQYKKMVNQKGNYLLGQPMSVQTDNEPYGKILRQVFDRRFQRLLKGVAEDSLNGGVGWVFVHYGQHGELAFRRYKPYEIIPGWADAEHTRLDYAIRVYDVVSYEDDAEQVVEKVEVYDEGGITFFQLSNGNLTPEAPFHQDYFTKTDEAGQAQGFNWAKIPLIAFKANNKEIPLIQMVRPLQDGINTILSNFQNQMEEDTRNTILVLVNYDGENLGEFRRNLATYGAVKVNTVDGTGGDLKTLQVEVNAENYQTVLRIFKKALIENAMGYDAKDDRMSGTPNQMNILSMYSDIDLDANGMETEFQASFEELLWFVDAHLFNVGLGDFEGVEVEVIFNRDILISEGESIENCAKSVGMLSDETIIANHPWVDDPRAELERIAKAKEAETQQYGNAFAGGMVNEE